MGKQHLCFIAFFLCRFASVSFGQTDQLYPRGTVFPLILYDVDQSDFVRVKAAGFNTVHIYSSTQSISGAQAYLQEAKRNGLFVMQNMPSSNSPSNSTFWTNFVNGVKSYDNLAWWYLPEEETASHQQPIAGIVRANDNRPTATYLPWDAEHTLLEYQSFLEVSTKGSYPNYYTEPRANCISWVESHLKVFPTVAPALEAFGDVPSPHEARYDAYASILAGAKGLSWYSYAYIKNNTAFWNALTQIAYEMAGDGNPDPIGQVVLSPRTTNTVTHSIMSGPIQSPTTYGKTYPSIMMLEKEYNGATYLLVVNNAQVYPGRAAYTDARVTVAFTVPNNMAQALVLFENGRKIEIADGHFTDLFEALEVHVYKLESAADDTTAPVPPSGVHVVKP